MRILFVTTRPPWPSRRGDQARVAGWVRKLAARHEISVIAQRPPGFPPAPFPPAVRGREVPLGRLRILRSLGRGWRGPVQVAWHYQPGLAEVVGREIADLRPDVAVIVLSRLGWLTPALDGVPCVVDLVDSLALNMRHRATRQPLLGSFWRLESRRIELWDHQLVRQAARAVVVSSRDREALVAGAGELRHRTAVIPFGIPLEEALPRRICEDPIVLLSGNLGYFPTRDGALWFAREIWPRIRRLCPSAQWWLAGSRIPRAVWRLERLPGVTVLEDPPDLATVRRQAMIAVAPMRSGSGTPIKVLEAMADGLPVVTTPEVAAGLDGLTGGEIVVAGDAEAFADAVVRLIEDPDAARAQVSNAWSWLREHHDLQRVADRFERLLEEVATSGPPPGRR